MQKKSQIILLLATIAGVAVLGMAPAWAESGDSTSDTSGDTSTSVSEDSSQSSEQGTETKDVKTEIESLRTESKDALVTARMHIKEHSTELKQRSCEARQASINRRVNAFAAAGQRHLNVFTSIFTKVQNFYTDKKLNVANYDTLVATVKDKQTAAQQAVDVLNGLDVNIDCTQPDPAQQLQTVKTAVSDARTALKAYRIAIKDLIVAIQGASTANSSTTEGSQQ